MAAVTPSSKSWVSYINRLAVWRFTTTHKPRDATSILEAAEKTEASLVPGADGFAQLGGEHGRVLRSLAEVLPSQLAQVAEVVFGRFKSSELEPH